MRSISGVIIHCAATRPEWMAGNPLSDKIAESRRWHVKGNGWADIGYHHLIDRNGEVGQGRALEKDGAHVSGHNRGNIGICLIGGHGSGADDRFDQHFTKAQDAALRRLLSDL